MKLDMIISGVGGQGILSISTIIGTAVVKKGLHFKQAEVHGMSQRGGDVQSHLRISDKPISSDLIQKGKANMILSVEPMESLRYLPYLNKEGWLITNSKPFVNMLNYPNIDDVLSEIKKIPHHIIIDANEIATEIGNTQVMNVVMLGAACEFMPFKFSEIQDAIKTIFSAKGEKVVEVNLKALEMGRNFSSKNK
jgi:indolepyruvate ferredoxin oxidoreductase beta subunit